MSETIKGLDSFSETYAAAKRKFSEACETAQGTLYSYRHPEAVDPDGEPLFIHVATWGVLKASNALLIISGTHGAEGYTGSAAQIALMQSGVLANLPEDVSVVLVHGLNPYGFAHSTRTNENNVDINRNFIDFSKPLPENRAYLELHPFLCPEQWNPQTKAEADEAIERWIEANGREAWTECIMKGQYEVPSGLQYGGQAAQWSSDSLREILAKHLPAVKKLGFIDWHTGLGQPGEPFFLCFSERGSPEWLRACEWWSVQAIENDDGYDGSDRPPYNGLVFYGVRDAMPQAAVTGAVVEFGVLPLKETFDQLRIDRWLRFGDVSGDAVQLAQLRRQVHEAFTSADPAWRSQVIAHAQQIQLAALEGLKAWT
ncbi:MAG: M14 family metallopeptidase [Ottowia sp.]|uniref:M14 family metallopeptidase n=1 Tax=Ottowia sp. TaxID=1898956 RepID=UPI0039E62E53